MIVKNKINYDSKILHFEKCFYQGNAKQYFLKLSLEIVGDQFRLQLSISDGLTDEYIEIDIPDEDYNMWKKIYGDDVEIIKEK